MDAAFEVVEILESDSDQDVSIESAECIVTEVDDDDWNNENGLMIEEMDGSESAEVADQGSEDVLIAVDPEVEEPMDLESPLLSHNIEFIFRDERLFFEPKLRHDTTLKELFAMVRRELTGVGSNEELWFRFSPYGLEIGEENVYTQEPKIGHLVRPLSMENTLKVEIDSRESFYSRFKDLLSSVDLNDTFQNEAANKRFKTSS